MKAAVVREHGAPDRLNFETDFPDPKPGPGDVIDMAAGTVTRLAPASTSAAMLDTLVAELIEKGDFFGVREALEKSMAEGSTVPSQGAVAAISSSRPSTTVPKRMALLRQSF